MRRSSRLLIAALLLALLAAIAQTAAGATESGAEATIEAAAGPVVRDATAEVELFERLNTLRASHGLDPLARDTSLDPIALAWTHVMVPQGSLSHRDDLRDQVEDNVTTEWRRIGENVGWGPSAEWLHNAFHDSAPHRANMLGDYNRVGIGALVETDGDVWVTVNFLKGPDLPVIEEPTPVPVADAEPPASWAVSPSGVVTPLGGAPFYGDPSALTLQQPIVGLASTPSGNGYWLVASDGGIFSYGDAAFHGSTGAIALNQPIVGMAPTNSGNGYWLVASDGGIFAFGDAAFHGSTGAMTLASPVMSIATTNSGNGYWLIAADGGVFTFGDAAFHGSAAGNGIEAVGMTPDAAGSDIGYWIHSSHGQSFGFGDGVSATTPMLDEGGQITGISLRAG